MTWDPAGSPAQLREALRSSDRPRVTLLCERLIAYVHSIDATYPELGASDLLRALRHKRYFGLLQRVADAFIQSGLDQPVIRRQYAQSLIDQGNLAAAVSMLEGLRAATSAADPYEYGEASGLLGRAYKQMYVATGPAAPMRRRRLLAKAVHSYDDVHIETGSLWHGINAVALLARAHRDGIPLDDFPTARDDARAMAARILRRVEEMGESARPWDRATAVEACVALGRHDDALAWLDSYLASPGTDAFELASTLRQLTEVWELSADRDPGQRLIPLLQADLLRREGGQVQVGAVDVTPNALERMDDLAGFEKIFGTERFNSLAWFRDALQRCRVIARIEDRYEGGVGTGFLVRGASLHRDLPDIVLVTNAHVLGDEAAPGGKYPQALSAGQALVTFRALEHAGHAITESHVTRVEWSSLPHELDTTIATIDSLPSDVLPLPVSAHRPVLDIDPPPQTYIIGHPRGVEQPMFSIRDNLLLDLDDVRVHYRTPTLEGSSGSPVFNAAWELIAIHHAGRVHMPRLHGVPGTYAANEGIWIERIRAELEQRGPFS